MIKSLESPDAAAREKILPLLNQSVDYFHADQDLGFARHNKIYNAAIREVRPGTVCTLFENAGHNEFKRDRSMHADMAAVCYESYTDYGDWPMSSAFAVDYSHSQSPNQPVWLTTCWGTSSEGKVKSLFHAFSRGLAGGGVPLEASNGYSENARRATAIHFMSQYGALAAHATPDRQLLSPDPWHYDLVSHSAL